MSDGAGDLAIVLHSHMPYVEGFGTYPFGEEWLFDAVIRSHLPVLEVARDLTMTVTPVLADQLEAEELKNEIPTDGSQHLTQEDLERIEKYTKGYDELYDAIEDKYNSAADVHAAVQKDHDYPVHPDVFRADLIKARIKELNKSLGRKAAQSTR